jgi:hypothetical protein
MFGLQGLALYVKCLARWRGDLVGMLSVVISEETDRYPGKGRTEGVQLLRWLWDDVLVPCLVPCTLGNSVVAKVKKKFGACGV